jgi:Tfp pilus assembly protein PilP
MKTDITLTSLILIILLAISGCGKTADESAEIWLHTAVFHRGPNSWHMPTA